MKHHRFLVVALILSSPLLAGNAYNGLDADGDGYLSFNEAQSNPALVSQWETIDVNEDNQIDEAEFAQFEVIGQEPQDEVEEILEVPDLPQ